MGYRIFNTFQTIAYAIADFGTRVIEIFTSPMSEVFEMVEGALPWWIEWIVKPIDWITQTVLPQGATLIDLMFVYGVVFMVVFGLVKFYSGE